MSRESDNKKFSTNDRVEKDRQLILDAQKKGKLATMGAYVKLSGPGWLQSAITLGGGSLSNSLYLGVLVGFSFMWLQPFAMILGIVMMSAIAYVTLSTGERPLRAINHHVSPVLGWGWLLASMMANIVWSMPQFSLATAAIQQNLFPNLFGADVMPDMIGKLIVSVVILAAVIANVMLYIQGGWGVKMFEVLIKIMVGSIVICFVGVVTKMTIDGHLDWSKIGAGMIPDLSLLKQPVEGFRAYIQLVDPVHQGFWNNLIVGQQRDVMIGAAATAVGINMTFLLPYSMLRKGWDKTFRGMAIFDLSTGLFIPFVIATACVVIASASQFHAKPALGFLGEKNEAGELIQPAKNLVGGFKGLVEKHMLYSMPEAAKAEYSAYKEQLLIDAKGNERLEQYIAELPKADKQLSAMLVKRDAFNLAGALAPLTGPGIARYVFGFGVLAMALNAATMLMLINGLCFCELLNKPAKGKYQYMGSLMVCVGILGPFFWKDAKMWLAVPTSVFAMVLLPIAYFAFLALMNQKSYLGDKMPVGIKRVVWNVLMAIAAVTASLASLWSLWSKLRYTGLGLFVGFLVLLGVVHVLKTRKQEV